MSVDAAGIAIALGVAVGCGLIPLAVLLHRVAAPSPAGAAALWLAGLAASVAAPSIVLVAALTRVRPSSQSGWGALGTAVCVLVCTVAAIGIGRLGIALARVRALKLAATRVDAPFALARRAALRISGEAPTPLAIGFRRPSVIIPAAVARTVDDVELAMIVGHENAHLARFDDWIKLCEQLACRALWFDPAVWFFARRLDEAREMACDDLAVRTRGDARAYAACLLRLFRSTDDGLAPAAWGARAQIARRIERLVVAPAAPERGRFVLFATAVIAAATIAVSIAIAPPLRDADPMRLARARPVASPAAKPLGGDRPARAFWHDDMMRPGNPLSAPYVRARL